MSSGLRVKIWYEEEELGTCRNIKRKVNIA
jgi:hypothetical protein